MHSNRKVRHCPRSRCELHGFTPSIAVHGNVCRGEKWKLSEWNKHVYSPWCLLHQELSLAPALQGCGCEGSSSCGPRTSLSVTVGLISTWRPLKGEHLPVLLDDLFVRKKRISCQLSIKAVHSQGTCVCCLPDSSIRTQHLWAHPVL